MKTLPSSKNLFALLLLILIDVIAIFYVIGESSIYFKEAQGFFNNSFFTSRLFNNNLFVFRNDLTHSLSIKNGFFVTFFHHDGLIFFLAHLGVWLVNIISGDSLLNDYGARVPFVILHIFSCIFLYHIAFMILKRPSHSLFCVLIFMLIPGVTLQAFLISNAGVITFITLLIIYYQLRFNRILYVAFIFIALLDSGGAILTLALFFYALIYKKYKTIAFGIILFGINMSIFSPIHGVPHTYILDALTSLLLLFSPVLFIYYLSTIYSFSFHNNHNKPTLLSLVPLIGFIFVFLVSTRQPIQAQSFFPALSVAVPLFIKRMLFMMNVRLPQFRFRYKMRIYAVIIFLILGNIIFFGNKITYLFVKEKNFAFSFYGAKEIARELYRRKITSIYVQDSALALRLRFYGIDAIDSFVAPVKNHVKNSPIKPFAPPKYKLIESSKGDIKIIYNGVIVTSYKVIGM